MRSMRTHWAAKTVSCLTILMALAAPGLGADTGRPAASGPQASGPSSPQAFLKQQGLQGRVALIQFGLVGCELSEAGLGKMMTLQKERKLPDVAYLRVEASNNAKEADEYFAAKSPGFRVCRDPDATVQRLFDATAWPTYVLVDKFGHVRYRGPWPEEAKLADWVAALVKETADPGPGVARFGVATLDVPKLLDETKLPALKGAAKPLREYMGKAGLLVVFVDAKCPFSSAAIAELPTVAETLAKHNVPCVVANLGEAEDTVRTVYEGKNLGGPVLYDATSATQKAWNVEAVPTVVLVDPAGGVPYRGKAVWKDLASAAEKSLKLAPGSLKFAAKGTEFG